jgi:hypothetical protein
MARFSGKRFFVHFGLLKKLAHSTALRTGFVWVCFFGPEGGSFS